MVDTEQLPSFSVQPLRVANEGFLVASTIERCPKTMMLRELVMNAVEAAAEAPEGGRLVRLTGRDIGGTRKLCIWNTGEGMTESELHAICDLASSLHKANSLEGNFGMGAKVASLPSNKLGIRYRSCHAGRVSEVTMGQREGVYGRLVIGRNPDGTTIDMRDVTQTLAGDADYDLSVDWTEVMLLGNRHGQDTFADPYDGNPAVSPGWIETYLTERFFRLPAGVRLMLPPHEAGAPAAFVPLGLMLEGFTRVESVPASNGIVIHYGYCADPTLTPDLAGFGAVVYRDETFARRSRAEWILESPNYSIPFGAAHCTVLVELPVEFGVVPDIYRQFLRFRFADQRQVYLLDFASLVRSSMPNWLRRIILSFGPPRIDYTLEIQSELDELLAELGVPAETRNSQVVRGAASPQAPVTLPPARFRSEKSPEIIGLRVPELIDERALQGRAARYYPSTHQLFVNLTYSSVPGMAQQLVKEFAAFPDKALLAHVAQELAEWAAIWRVGRGLAYSLSKKSLGWPPEEVARVQSPECLSLLADDFFALMPVARSRVAERLGIAPPADAASDEGQMSVEMRLAVELADAEQAARRALANPAVNPVPILRRVSSIEARRGNFERAIHWAQQAVEADPGDPASYSHLSRQLLVGGDLDGAEAAILKAMELEPEAPARVLRQMADVERLRRNYDASHDWLRRAIEVEPADYLNYSGLASLLQLKGDLDGAEEAAMHGLALQPDRRSILLRQMATIERSRRNYAAALEWAEQAVEDDPSDHIGYFDISQIYAMQGNLGSAERSARRALSMAPQSTRYLRQLSSIARQRQNLDEALDWVRRALELDGADLAAHEQHGSLLLALNDLAGARSTAERMQEIAPQDPSKALRLLSSAARQGGDLDAAVDFARQAVAAAPSDMYSHLSLAGVLMARREWDAAYETTSTANELAGGRSARLLRQLSVIEQQRRNLDAAVALARDSVDVDPTDAGSHNHLSIVLLQAGDLDGAEVAARKALEIKQRADAVAEATLAGN